MLRLFVFAISCLVGLVQGAEWKSPHPLALEKSAPAALIPFPQEVEWGKGSLPMPPREGWIWKGATEGEMVRTAREGLLAGLGEGMPGTQLTCVLKLDREALPAARKNEGYRLRVSAKGVSIVAASEAGLFNGLQTLRQLAEGRDSLPFCRIVDYPAFAMRGFMHDCGRNFQTIESLKHQLDLAARLKINFFQWHLTDHPAWHVECKAYPVLNDPAKRTRDKDDTYTYDQIRELFAYARARNITIIPELDMPGHSAYFNRCFGFAMHSEKGMEVLEKLIEEFCTEIPAEICPYLHIGADEVKIPNAEAFVKRMSDKVMSFGRRPMQWGGPRDLPVGKDSVTQRWGEGGEMVNRSVDPKTIRSQSYDSTMGYSNLFDPALLVRRYFFMRPCGVAKGDSLRMGAMICHWPDTRVEDKSKIALHSAQWPGMCAMAERAWVGGAADGDKLPEVMPAPESEATQAYSLFEKRMMALRRTIFRDEHFPFWEEMGVSWKVVPPVDSRQAESVRNQLLQKGKRSGVKMIPAYGANLYFRTRPATGFLGMFRDAKPGMTAWAVTNIRAEKEGEAPFMVGFDAPARSSRRCSGVPAAGEWSQCGTRIWINGEEVRNPRTYRLAGKGRYPNDTWSSPANEVPLDDEEVWWAQEPVMLPLRKGNNTIIIEQPYIGVFQSWGVSLIPLPR